MLDLSSRRTSSFKAILCLTCFVCVSWPNSTVRQWSINFLFKFLGLLDENGQPNSFSQSQRLNYLSIQILYMPLKVTTSSPIFAAWETRLNAPLKLRVCLEMRCKQRSLKFWICFLLKMNFFLCFQIVLKCWSKLFFKKKNFILMHF